MARENSVPIEITKRLREWRIYFKISHRLHYLVGLTGVLISPLAIMDPAKYGAIVGAISGVCIGILGFAQPYGLYRRFVSAWRHLDTASLKYQYNLISIESLLDALDQSEDKINGAELEKAEGRDRLQLPAPDNGAENA